MIRMIAAAGLVFLGAAILPAEASTVSASWTGHITELFYIDKSTSFGYDVTDIAGVKKGDSFQLDYSYDTNAKVYDTFTSSAGSIGADYFANSFSLTLDSFHVGFAHPIVTVEDFPDSSSFLDRFAFWGSHFFETPTSNIPGFSVDGMFLTQYVLQTVLQGTGLPGSPLDPANDFGGREFELSLIQPGTGNDYRIVGSFAPLAPTPIPGSAPLLLTALGGLGFAAWTRRRA